MSYSKEELYGDLAQMVDDAVERYRELDDGAALNALALFLQGMAEAVSEAEEKLWQAKLYPPGEDAEE